MLSVTLTLTPEQQARLQEGLDRRDPHAVRRVLLDAVEPTVETLLHDVTGDLSVEEFMILLDQMADIASRSLPPDWPGLSDYAVSREGIYGDHP